MTTFTSNGGPDNLVGTDGDDTFVFTGVSVSYPPPPTGSIDGGAGTDTIDSTGVSPSNMYGGNDTDGLLFRVGNQDYHVKNVEIFRFGGDANYISLGSTSATATIFAGAGDDTIFTSTRTTGSTVYAGDGNDSLQGAPGDRLYGESGNDSFFISGSFGAPVSNGVVDGGAGVDLLQTNIAFTVDLAAGTAVAGSANYSVTGIENVAASVYAGYDATVSGDDGANVLTATNTVGGTDGRAIFDGRGGNDTLVGANGNDTLTGGAGADTLTGGAGADTFRDTLANMYGDTITDLSAGDKIVFTDIGYAGFSYGRIGTTLAAGSGAITLSNNPVGHLIVSADSSGGTALGLGAHVTGLNDFNGDGHSDLLWRNSGSGTFTAWDIRGNATGNSEQQNAYANGSVDNSWQVQGTVDFNGDGASDIVWRNSSSGALTIWNGQGNGGFAANAYVGNGYDTSWTMAGFGDFNADGKDDILWRNANGTITEWQSTGSGFTQNVYSNGSVDNSWKIVGVGDFNGDGKSDILWRNTGGAFTEWTSTGSGFTPNAYVNGGVDTSWHVAAVGDFNGDGKDDLIFRNDNGTFTEWQSTGSGFNANVYVNGSVGTDWQLQGVYDFNDDGKADLLWRNASTGAFTVWQSTGNGFTPNTLVDGSVGTDWQLMTHHYDFV